MFDFEVPNFLYSCVGCKKKISDEDKFCKHCGRKFSSEDIDQMQKEAAKGVSLLYVGGAFLIVFIVIVLAIQYALSN